MLRDVRTAGAPAACAVVDIENRVAGGAKGLLIMPSDSKAITDRPAGGVDAEGTAFGPRNCRGQNR